MIKGPRGTKDILSQEAAKWQYLEEKFRSICERFGYGEVRTPTFEHTELFERSVGETTDVVQKEMYTFVDKGDRSITLKPEGTASVIRSYIENKVYSYEKISKIYYITPCFRYERPQAGRLREFHQFGIELIGTQNPNVDAEVISLVDMFFKEIGLVNIELRINSIGCPKCREIYNNKLKAFLEPKLSLLCDTCNDRFNKNPMRIIDCKNEKCQSELTDAPKMIDNICEECSNHFVSLKTSIDKLGVKYEIDPNIVRGLDYYTKTAFEFVSKDIGTQSTICGGGRYDNLIESLGGTESPAVGFAMGIERLLLTLENNKIDIPVSNNLDVFIISIGERAESESFKLLYDMRNNGINGDKDFLERGIKPQFKLANKLGAKYTVIIGDEELDKGIVSLKNMETGEQEEVKIEDLIMKIQEEK